MELFKRNARRRDQRAEDGANIRQHGLGNERTAGAVATEGSGSSTLWPASDNRSAMPVGYRRHPCRRRSPDRGG
jgi:hypothetical protein